MAASATPAAVTSADPSMEDILASIRRILSEDETAPPAAGGAAASVLLLDDSMLVQPPAAAAAGDASVQERVQSIESDLAQMILAEKGAHDPSAHDPEAPHHPGPDHAMPAPPALDAHMPDAMMPDAPQHAPSEHAAPPSGPPPNPAPYDPLVAPEPAAATQSVVLALMRQLSTERTTPVYRSGPSIEDLVREEMRPLLKHWLDTNLPPMVERLVRSELDRLIARAAP